jgi:GntR family transcriptional regulator
MIESRSSQAVYKTLAADLRHAINVGDYAEGQQLPTEKELSDRYSVGRQTIRRAMQDLVQEGLIYRVPGRGSYPMPERDRYVQYFDSVEDLPSLSIDTQCELISPLQREVDIANAGRLRLPTDDVASVQYLCLHGEVPFGLTSVTVPPRIGEALSQVPELTSTTTGRSRIVVVGLIEKFFPGSVVNAEQSVTALDAPPAVAPYLNCEVGDSLLRVDRLYSDASDAPIELAVTYFNPRHYSLRERLRRRRLACYLTPAVCGDGFACVVWRVVVTAGCHRDTVGSV